MILGHLYQSNIILGSRYFLEWSKRFKKAVGYELIFSKKEYLVFLAKRLSIFMLDSICCDIVTASHQIWRNM